MSSTKKTIAEGAQSAIARKLLAYARGGDPDVQLPKMLKAVDALVPKDYLVEQRALFHEVIDNPDNNWMVLLKSLWADIDLGVLQKVLENFLVNASLVGLRRQDAAAAEYGCNVPWAMLVDPTSACNLHCTGCWAAEYGDRLNLTFEELDSIVDAGQGAGRVLLPVRRRRAARAQAATSSACARSTTTAAFTAFTNATLIDDAFAEDMLRVRNFIPAISRGGLRGGHRRPPRRGHVRRCRARHGRAEAATSLPFGVSVLLHHAQLHDLHRQRGVRTTTSMARGREVRLVLHTTCPWAATPRRPS